jgi:hypothetical protein
LRKHLQKEKKGTIYTEIAVVVFSDSTRREKSIPSDFADEGNKKDRSVDEGDKGDEGDEDGEDNIGVMRLLV